MPHHPSEEHASEPAGHITDKIASNPSSNTESTASDHSMHADDKQATEHAHQSKGPVILKEMPEKEDRAANDAKMKELNKE